MCIDGVGVPIVICDVLVMCINMLGSYSCDCLLGYVSDGVVGCVDMDECVTDNGGCGDVVYYLCTNNEGGALICVDIDEC